MVSINPYDTYASTTFRNSINCCRRSTISPNIQNGFYIKFLGKKTQIKLLNKRKNHINPIFNTVGLGLVSYIFGLLFVSCNHKQTLFQLLPSSQTGIHFNNKVEENDKYNVLEYMNIYTGAGVAAGDVNNDGLVDLYFSANQTTGRL